MISQIPELGVVIVGNQAGRVGILTATGIAPSTKRERLKYTKFKIDCILPFKSQEDLGLRPMKPLMGIAVGPIQGHENTSADLEGFQDEGIKSTKEPSSSSVGWGSCRRFRLFVMYADHTVLTYEISRPMNRDVLVV